MRYSTGSAPPSPNSLNKAGNDTPVQASLTPAHYIEACRKRQARRKTGAWTQPCSGICTVLAYSSLCACLPAASRPRRSIPSPRSAATWAASAIWPQSQGLLTGTSFTTDPDPARPGIAAQAFGAQGTNSRAGGSNHAWGGGGDQDACLARSTNPPANSALCNCVALEIVPGTELAVHGPLNSPGPTADRRALSR